MGVYFAVTSDRHVRLGSYCRSEHAESQPGSTAGFPRESANALLPSAGRLTGKVDVLTDKANQTAPSLCGRQMSKE